MRKIFLLLLTVTVFQIANAQETVPSDTLKEYAGKYKFPEGTPFAEVTITFDNGTLIATSSAGSSELKRRDGDTFDIVAFGGIAIFKRNESKKIARLHVMVSDVDVEGEKIDGSPDPAPQFGWWKWTK